jgi:uncharacterized protein (TIGR02217 family)
MAFRDERLLELVGYGFTGGPTFSTTRVSLVSGHERRNAERSRPKYRYTAPFDAIDTSHQDIVIGAYVANLGPVHSFRFKDWADYTLDNEELGQAVGGGEDMQLVKNYTFGDPAVPGFNWTVTRPITKPVDSTRFTKAAGYVTDSVALTLTEDTGGGPAPLAFTCDYTTGIVTFTATAGAIIRAATGEFDVPVHFDDDSLDFTFQNWRAHSTEIVLVEDFGA